MTQDARTFLYMECDIPPGLSIAVWRSERVRTRAPRRLARLLR
jgi:hypothetical protein